MSRSTAVLVAISSVLSLSSIASASSLSFVTPEAKIEQHVKLADHGNAVNGTVTTTTKGSLVYLDAGSSCTSSVQSGFGFTLGECVVRDNEGSGVIYSNCYTSGGQVKFTFTKCEDTRCTT
ncbi:unnamed protein product, partial [Symbiodinium microadriaticum]